MEKLPASDGWLWVKEGFALFRKQPAEISALFMGYMLMMIGVGIVPLVGQLLPLVLVPVFAMAFMQACADIEEGKKVTPRLLLTGFRSPAFPSLIKLGLLYLVASVVAIGASALVDGGVFWNIMTGSRTLDDETIANADLLVSMLVSATVYTPAAMAFWYAAPLIAWQKMGVAKAVFYSFFAVRNNLKTFLVYGVSWVLIGVLLPSVISTIVGVLVGRAFILMALLLSMSLLLTVIMYCSFYPTYTHVFGRPRPARDTLPD